MSVVDADRWNAELIAQTAALAELTSADPDRAVPTCPGWTFRNLATHVGRGHRWAAEIVRTRSAGAIPMNQVPDGRLPDEPADQITWINNAAALVREALDGAGTDPVWTFTGPRPPSWWGRRRAHEVAVHLADARLAAGLDPAIAPDFAADGIDEWLGLLAARGQDAGLAQARPGGDDRSLHFHATDPGLDGGEWLVHRTPAGISVSAGHAKADVAVRGPAAGLLLALLRRQPPEQAGVEVIGDAELFADWLATTAF